LFADFPNAAMVKSLCVQFEQMRFIVARGKSFGCVQTCRVDAVSQWVAGYLVADLGWKAAVYVRDWLAGEADQREMVSLVFAGFVPVRGAQVAEDEYLLGGAHPPGQYEAVQDACQAGENAVARSSAADH
jgi:hypothetical protein